jgi:dUTP pyrophosphatase
MFFVKNNNIICGIVKGEHNIMMEVYIKKLVKDESLPLPRYSTDGAAGMDLYACVNEDVTIEPGKVKLIPTGYAVKVPDGYEIQIRSRSGLALKNGIIVLNSPGTIDSDYTGEIKIILINLGDTDFKVKKYDRIAQMVLNKIDKIQFTCTDNLPVTKRRNGGFGHTGI